MSYNGQPVPGSSFQRFPFCGFHAVASAMSGAFSVASIAILAAMILDSLDEHVPFVPSDQRLVTAGTFGAIPDKSHNPFTNIQYDCAESEAEDQCLLRIVFSQNATHAGIVPLASRVRVTP